MTTDLTHAHVKLNRNKNGQMIVIYIDGQYHEAFCPDFYFSLNDLLIRPI